MTAIGTKLGERARTEPGLDTALRAAPTRAAFEEALRARTEGLLAPALVESFLRDVLTDADWVQWRSRVLLQLKMVRDGAKPAPGHDAGKGVGRP